MKNTKEMSRVEQVVYNMREEIKNAILNEEADVEYKPSDSNGYYAEMRVRLGTKHFEYFDLTIADTFVCYHNPFVIGMFDKKSDFKKLTKIVQKHVKRLSSKEIEEIVNLQKKIDEIKRGGSK